MAGKEDILGRQPFIDKVISILEILSEEKEVHLLPLMVTGVLERLLYWNSLRNSLNLYKVKKQLMTDTFSFIIIAGSMIIMMSQQ